MFKINCFLLLAILLLPLTLRAQYVTYNSSDTVALRELPYSGAKVIETYGNFTFVPSIDDECGFGGDPDDSLFIKYTNDCKVCGDSCNKWMFTGLGYINNDNLLYYRENKELEYTEFGDSLIVFQLGKDTIIKVTFIPFDSAEYIIDREHRTIDGIYAIGGTLYPHYEAKEAEIIIGGNNTDKIDFTRMYDPTVSVYKGKYGEFYFKIQVGDGSESFSIVWVIVDGKFGDSASRYAC